MRTNSAQDDLTVIRQVLAGRTEAFRVLVQRYEKPVFRLVWNLASDSHQAEDIAQDAFLAAYRNLRQFDSQQGAFRTWLLAIARNKCWNTLQKKRPVSSREQPTLLVHGTPDDECIQREFQRDLDIALDELAPDLKTVFVLAELVGLAAAEIGEIEGVKPGTVRSRLSRAKRHLRTKLKAHVEKTE